MILAFLLFMAFAPVFAFLALIAWGAWLDWRRPKMPDFHRERYRGFDLSFVCEGGMWTGKGTCRMCRFWFGNATPDLATAVARARAGIDAHYACEAEEHCAALRATGTVTLKL